MQIIGGQREKTEKVVTENSHLFPREEPPRSALLMTRHAFYAAQPTLKPQPHPVTTAV
jgi:hypothetical protein